MTRARSIGRAGFTILELMVTLAIVAVLAITLSMGVRRVRSSDLRADTTSVAQALRSAYNYAAATGKHHRVVFDLDTQTYKLERCEGDIKLRKERFEMRPDDQNIDEAKLERAMDFLQGKRDAFSSSATSEFVGEIQSAMSPEEAAAKAAALAGVRVGMQQCGPPLKRDGTPNTKLAAVRKVNTENDIRIRRIHVEHLQDPQEEGQVTINFFPLGTAEKAVVEIDDSDDDQFILLVHRLTGRVEFKDGDWKDVDEFMDRGAAGDREEDR